MIIRKIFLTSRVGILGRYLLENTSRFSKLVRFFDRKS